MKTGSRTHVFLERGTEDLQLLSEIHKITAATGITGRKEFVRKYPKLNELRQGLEAEKEC